MLCQPLVSSLSCCLPTSGSVCSAFAEDKKINQTVTSTGQYSTYLTLRVYFFKHIVFTWTKNSSKIVLKYTVKNSIYIKIYCQKFCIYNTYCCKERRQIQPSNPPWLLHFFPSSTWTHTEEKGMNPHATQPSPPPKEKKRKDEHFANGKIISNTCSVLEIRALVFESTGGPRTLPDFPLPMVPREKPRSSWYASSSICNAKRHTWANNLHQTSHTLGNMFTCIHSPQQQLFPHTAQFYTVETSSVDEVCVGSDKKDVEWSVLVY